MMDAGTTINAVNQVLNEKKGNFQKSVDSAKSMAWSFFILIPAIALGVAFKLGNHDLSYGFKEYLDEIADVCSILLFAYVVSTTFYIHQIIHLIKEEVDGLFEKIHQVQQEMERARVAAMNRMDNMNPPEECTQQ